MFDLVINILFHLTLKVPGLISQNGDFYSTDTSSPQNLGFKLHWKNSQTVWINEEIIPYASYVFVIISSKQYILHFFSCKFTSILVMRNIWAFFWCQNLSKLKNIWSNRTRLLQFIIIFRGIKLSNITDCSLQNIWTYSMKKYK